MLQAMDDVSDLEAAYEVLLRGFAHATKSQLQIQTAAKTQIIQMRRHWFLNAATLVPQDGVQQLNHVPVVGQRFLFPFDILLQINDRVLRDIKDQAVL